MFLLFLGDRLYNNVCCTQNTQNQITMSGVALTREREFSSYIQGLDYSPGTINLSSYCEYISTNKRTSTIEKNNEKHLSSLKQNKNAQKRNN